MYFAVETADTDTWKEDLFQVIDRGQPDTQWLALIDGALDHDRKPFALAGRAIRLYGQVSTLSDLVPASPYLLPLHGEAGTDIREMVSALAEHCNGRPMLSFLATRQSVDELVRSWLPFLQPEATDGDRYLLRFADTRVLAALPATLEAATWAALTSMVSRWLVVGREATLTSLPMTGVPQNSPMAMPSMPARLSAAEVDRMLDAAMPDAIIDILYRQCPGVLQSCRPAVSHRVTAEACALARRYGIDATPDIALLALHAIETNGSGIYSQKLLTLMAQGDGGVREYLLDLQA